MDHTLRRLAGRAYNHVGSAARRWLPAPLKRHLARYVRPIETALSGANTAPGALERFAPLIAEGEFASGPIVHVNNALAWGGAERQLINTLLGLADRVDRDLVLLCQKLGENEDYDFHRATLSSLGDAVRNMTPIEEARPALLSRFGETELQRATGAIDWLPGDVQERIWRLAADFAALKPRVVHAWQDALSIEAAYAARIVGVPRIIASARNLPPMNFAYDRPYMYSAYREIAACAGIAMLNNSEAGAHAYAAWLGFPPSRIQVLRNGFAGSAPVQDRAAVRAELGVPENAALIGSIFRFYEEKRPLLWMEAAAQIAARSNAHFVVYGLGPLLEESKTMARRAGFIDRLHLPGAQRDAASKLAAFDVFMLTSLHEGTPNVVLEASAAGVPVVSTAAGGAVEAILDGISGRLVDPPTPDALAEAVLSILADETFRKRCTERAPAFVAERFGLGRMLDETLALYALDAR